MNFYDICKRALDIVGAVVGIILFFPIMFVASSWVKIISPRGPILADMPLRVGKDKKLFKLFKIRSMIPNAHELMLKDPALRKLHRESGYKLDPDPRLLKGGKFIRKSSIDEMPQFFNVLLGHMSLVGPRAYFSHEVDERIKEFPKSKPLFKRAFSIKPGITGPWQVGGRATLTFMERIKLDADYAEKRSIVYDLLIILKTPLAVLKSEGAY